MNFQNTREFAQSLDAQDQLKKYQSEFEFPKVNGKKTIYFTRAAYTKKQYHNIRIVIMKLKDILYKVAIEAVHGSTDIDVNTIHFDSRKIESNDVFVAIKGTLSDGHSFIDKAISLCASVVVCEDLPVNLLSQITYVQVKDTNEALAHLATNFYDNPSRKLSLVGVTGTNGKTTIASLLFQMFKKAI